ncbi:MAG: ParA family protein [Alphaproteobacteria bacterium]|nr:ParA family protein [Alphaproteobacteria bacterium]
MIYAIWNNKGGVGKSFLTFALSCQYAHDNPDRKVCVVDMCPQANVSEILLGGNGKGSVNLTKLLNQTDRKTIGGYFDDRLRRPNEKTGEEGKFPIKAFDYNNQLPENLYLIVGDPSLEVQTEAINQIAGQTLPKDVWKNVHSWLKDLIDTFSFRYENTVFFIDCNPSFSAYTELAIVAAEKLIIPCTADGSSARAINNIKQLIYGHNVPKQYEDAIFSKRIQKEGLTVPSIAKVLLNRSTQYNKSASKAFSAMFDAIKTEVGNLITTEPLANSGEENLFDDIPDTHSVAIVASHLGMPIHTITVGQYEVHDQNPQVNHEPLARYQEAIKKVTGEL